MRMHLGSIRWQSLGPSNPNTWLSLPYPESDIFFGFGSLCVFSCRKSGLRGRAILCPVLSFWEIREQIILPVHGLFALYMSSL